MSTAPSAQSVFSRRDLFRCGALLGAGAVAAGALGLPALAAADAGETALPASLPGTRASVPAPRSARSARWRD